MMENYGWGLPVAASSFAKELDSSLFLIHAAMILIFVLWAIFFTYCLIRYRHREGHSAEYVTHSLKSTFKSLIPDGLVLAFEIWLIFIFGLPIWANIKEHFPSEKESTRVHITAQQFSWNVHYPGPDGVFGRTKPELVDSTNPVGLDLTDPAAKDDVVTVNELHAPVDKPLLINLTAQDVIHSFFVPEFRIKQDAVPGMKVNVWVRPIKEGQFEIGCAQLCGVGHYRMRGDVFVESPEKFQAWYNSQLTAQVPAPTPAPIPQWE